MACPGDDELLEFSQARLTAGARAVVEAHLADCNACRTVVAELVRQRTREAATLSESVTEPAALPGEGLPPGATVGRYVIGEQLGAGAMGVVYAASDPQLGRRIAVKVLRSVGPDWQRARARLLREGAAIARLSHPNVVTVFDVGEFGERAFVAIELVEGPTLQEKLRAEKPAWRDVLALFVQAGRGLAAAHAAALVHRDFKPANVLVGRDGRVRVADFGLARLPSETDTAPAPSPSPAPPDVTVPATQPGGRVGTPAYMSPEQHRAGEVDARTDQFAFCVALYEALAGQRPFAGATSAELVDAIEAGNVRPPPRGSPVPARIFAALRRGLSARPQDRFPSMDALLAELTREPALKKWGWAAAGAAVLAAMAMMFVSRSPALCEGAESELAGVWDEPVQQAVHASLLGGAGPAAADTWQRLRGVLDGYARSFVQMRTEACISTRVRGVQPEKVMDLRMDCLTERRRHLAALTSQLRAADAKALPLGLKAALSLEPLSQCADTRALLAQVVPPPDKQRRAQVEAVRDQIAQVRATGSVGKIAQAAELAQKAVESARATGYKPVLAQAMEVYGVLLQRRGKLAEAREMTHSAAIEAEAGGDDREAARIYTNLCFFYEANNENDEARLWCRHAQAAIDRLGGDDLLQGRLFSELGQLVGGEPSGYAEALADFEKASPLLERTAGPESSALLINLAREGNVLRHVDPPRAIAVTERAAKIFEKNYGESSIELANTVRDLGETNELAGRREEAERQYQRSIAIFERAGEGGNYYCAVSRADLAAAQREDGNFAAALANDTAALAAEEKALGPDAAKLVFPLTGMGQDQLALGKPAEALKALTRALALKGADRFPQGYARAQFALAQALPAAEHARALQLAASARDNIRKLLPNPEAQKLLAQIDAFADQARR